MTKDQIHHIENTYRGKRVLVTGHTGFKGSWLIAWLNKLGAIVKGYALKPSTDPALFSVINGENLCESEIGDVRNFEQLSKGILKFQPDFIFHMAAQPLVRYSYEAPVETFETNVMGTINVLESIRQMKKRCVVVIITTDKVYENREWEYGYREHDPLGGYDPYSASKAAAEIVTSSYRNSFFSNHSFSSHLKSVASVRAGNVIGGGDWAVDRIFPDLMRARQSGNTLQVRSPSSIRPWQHVIEPLGGYLLLAAKMDQDGLAFNEAWNFGPSANDTLTVKDLVNTAKAVLNFDNVVFGNSHGPHEAVLLSLDITKASVRLSWTPKYSAAQSVERTISWYKQFYLGVDPMHLIVNDINDYTS